MRVNFGQIAADKIDDRSILPLPGERSNEGIAGQDAHYVVVFHYGKVLLCASQDQTDHMRQRITRRKRLEFGLHGARDRNAADRVLHLRQAGFLGSANPYKESDEEQEGIRKQPDETEQE